MARKFQAEGVEPDFLTGFRPSDFDGRTYAYRIVVEPEKTQNANGSLSISLGFPALLVSAFVGDPEGIAIRVAEVLTRHMFEADPPQARPMADWHDADGNVLWWDFPVREPPYCGTPNDNAFPEYKTHWTPIGPMPVAPPEAVDAD